MAHASTASVGVVIPNWNGKDELVVCLDSLLKQSIPVEIIVVENGSIDNSAEIVKTHYPSVTLLEQPKNLGFDGGVNVGIRYALAHKLQYVALFNNDAVADKHWLEQLVAVIEAESKTGIVTSKFMSIDKKHLDSTGDLYTTWGLAYPRGRGEPVSDIYDTQTVVFGASGGASLYRCSMLEKIGLFDEDFFAYYEDVDISFRAQLTGWEVRYAPKAIAYHQISATTSRIKGFATYQTMKNYPWVLWKNVPRSLLPTILPRFILAYNSFFVSAIARGEGWPALKGYVISLVLLPKKFGDRRWIQKHKQVTDDYIRSMLTWDLPPNAKRLRNVRQKWRNITGKKANA